MPKESLGQQHADFLSALQFTHFSFVQCVGNIQAFQQNGRIALRAVAVFLADDAFQFAQLHAVGVSHLRLGVNLVALFHGRPQALVAHDDGVEHAIAVEGKLVLAQNTKLSRAHDCPLLRLQFAGQQIHEGGFAGAIRPGQAIPLARRKCRGYFVKQNFGAVAHGHIADRNHGFNGKCGKLPNGRGRNFCM